MNTYFKIFISFCLLSFTVSCNKEIEKFSNQENFIYFDKPFKLDASGKPSEEYVESIKYSFALEDESYKTHIVKIPINTISLAAETDRTYKVEIVQDSTTATSDDWEMNSLENTTIKAGSVVDTLQLHVKRSVIMEKEERTIYLRLVPNDNFRLGVPSLTTIKVVISDILLEPAYWVKIKKYVGTVYYKEVYRKWMEIYYLGADPNTESISYAPNYGKLLWHGNMPHLASSMSAYYPSTHMFLGILKKYFDEHDVYPNGDTTKEPIRLPRV